jgi:hypothetical protein
VGSCALDGFEGVEGRGSWERAVEGGFFALVGLLGLEGGLRGWGVRCVNVFFGPGGVFSGE